MPRKIKARTLGRLVTRYLDESAKEAAGHVEDCDPLEGAEVLALLPEDRAWRLLRLLPGPSARRWLESCPDEGLQNLIRQARPDAPPVPEQERGGLEESALAILTAGPGRVE